MSEKEQDNKIAEADTTRTETDDESLLDFALIRWDQKLAQIAELVQLMEESNKEKDWLVAQIHNKHQKIAIKPGLSKVAILKMCSSDFVTHLLELLKNQELEVLDDNSPLPLTQTYHWFFTDIVAGSDPKLPTSEQARKIIVLNKLIERTDTFRQQDSSSTLILPTGDGVAIGFNDSPEKPLKLALELHENLNRYNSLNPKKSKILIRIGLDIGPVYEIKDLKSNENVWGPGIIMARRIMDLAIEMNILASARFANDVKMLKPEYRDILHAIGDYQIKHGEKILIYNVYGDGFGNKKKPPPDRGQKSRAAEEIQKAPSRFLFNRLAIELEVMDEEDKMVMTHHTITQNFVNVSNESIERLFFYLDGDIARDFPDLNVRVKDEDDNELELLSLDVNKTLHKEFFMKLSKPIKPGEKGTAKLEYDWEETERKFLYRFASDCKKFSFLLTVPRGMKIHQKIVEVSTETGDKKLASIPPVVKYLEEKTQVLWDTSNIRAYAAYRFDW